MASDETVKRKPVASSASLSNNADKKAATTRFCGFEAQTVATFIFQLVALIVALVFGAWAIKSYDATLRANDLQASSNAAADQQASAQLQVASTQHEMAVASGQLAMAEYCQRYGYPQDTALCDAIITGVPLASIASIFSFIVPPPPINPTTTSTTVSAPSTGSGDNRTTKVTRTTSRSQPPASVTRVGTTADGSSPSPSSLVGSPSVPEASSSSPRLGLGAIIGIIVGGVNFVGVVIAFIMVRRRKRSQTPHDE